VTTLTAVFALVMAYAALVAAYLALRTLAKLRRATALLSRGTATDKGHQSLVEVVTEHVERTIALDEALTATRAHVATELAQARRQLEEAKRQTLAQFEETKRETLQHLDGTEQQLRKAVDQSTRESREHAEAVTQHALDLIAQEASGYAGALRNIALIRYDAFRGMSGRMSFSLALLDESGTGITISALAGPGDTRVYAKGVADGRGEHELTPEEAQAVSAALGASQSRSIIRRAS
jgi:exonuclease VII large subunit